MALDQSPLRYASSPAASGEDEDLKFAVTKSTPPAIDAPMASTRIQLRRPIMHSFPRPRNPMLTLTSRSDLKIVLNGAKNRQYAGLEELHGGV
jgi:hypothetical protein